jgi:hypothetical protein
MEKGVGREGGEAPATCLEFIINLNSFFKISVYGRASLSLLKFPSASSQARL